MFRSIVGAMTKRFAGAKKPVPQASPPVAASPEVNDHSKLASAPVSDHSQSAAEGAVLAAEPNGNGTAIASIPDSSRSVADSEIGLRAYLMWEAAGKPKEAGSRFWLQAKEELLGGK
jgi:hypothetical protein